MDKIGRIDDSGLIDRKQVTETEKKSATDQNEINPEDQRRKKSDEDGPDLDAEHDITLAALRVVIQDQITTLEGHLVHDNTTPDTPNPGTSRAQKAASAYQHAADANLPRGGTHGGGNNSQDTINQISSLQGLLNDIEKLESRGITKVTVTLRDTFYTAIHRALDQT